MSYENENENEMEYYGEMEQGYYLSPGWLERRKQMEQGYYLSPEWLERRKQREVHTEEQRKIMESPVTRKEFLKFIDDLEYFKKDAKKHYNSLMYALLLITVLLCIVIWR